MSLENTTARYTIEITRDGNGAALAVQDFKSVEEASKRLNQATAKSSDAIHELGNAAKLTKASMHTLAESTALVAGSHFPELTNAVYLVANSMKTLKLAAVATHGGLLPLAAVGATIGAGFAIVASGVKMMNAELDAARAKLTLLSTQQDAFKRLVETLGKLEASGKLTPEKAQILHDALSQGAQHEVSRAAAQFVTQPGQLAAIKQIQEAQNDMEENALQGYERERRVAFDAFNKRIAMINEETLKFTSDENLRASVIDANADSELLKFKTVEDLKRDLRAKAELEFQTKSREIEKKEEDDRLQAATKARQEYDQKVAEIKSSLKAAFAETDKDANAMIEDQERKLTIAALTGSETREQRAVQEFQTRVQLYQDLYEAGFITESKLTKLNQEATIKRLEATRKETLIIKQVAEGASREFASGFAQAFVDFASGAKSASQAFKEFAASFLKDISKMIIEAEVFALLKALLGFASGGTQRMNGDFGGETSHPAKAARGGSFPILAASGVPGVSSISRATYFPKFNVVGGEAGQEMLTILARPRFMKVGGMDAVVGNAGSNRLAITQASDLAQGGANGSVEIRVSMDPSLRAEIVNESVQGAVVLVTQHMGRHSRLRDVTKKSIR